MRISELNAPDLARATEVNAWWQRVRGRPSFSAARIEPFDASYAAERAATTA